MWLGACMGACDASWGMWLGRAWGAGARMYPDSRPHPPRRPPPTTATYLLLSGAHCTSPFSRGSVKVCFLEKSIFCGGSQVLLVAGMCNMDKPKPSVSCCAPNKLCENCREHREPITVVFDNSLSRQVPLPSSPAAVTGQSSA